MKVDVDQVPELARRYRIRSIPTLVYLRDGEALDAVVDAMPAQVLQAITTR